MSCHNLTPYVYLYEQPYYKNLGNPLILQTRLDNKSFQRNMFVHCPIEKCLQIAIVFKAENIRPLAIS